MLELQHVSRRVGGETYLDDISISLQRGELTILLGPTLSGKTSLMRLMAGLDKPDSGTILFDNKSVLGVPVQKRNVAMVYQQFINYPTLSVLENIASPLRVAGIGPEETERRVAEVAELLRLTPLLSRKPDALSGGQQQRVALARALIKRAQLVLLDEPLANLDYKLREELRAELPRLFADMGAVLVYATTEPSEALILGGNTVCLHEGRVVEVGSTMQLYRQPAGLLTAALFSDPPLNTVPVHASAGQLTFPASSSSFVLPDVAALDGEFVLGVRPHHLRTQKADDSDIELQVNISVTELSGSESYVHFEFHDQPWVALLHGIRDYVEDDIVIFYIEPRHVLLFDALTGSRIGNVNPIG